MLGIERAVEVLLPDIVEGAEEDEVAGEGAAEGADGCLLVRFARDRGAVAVAVGWPARLRDDGVLAAASLLDALGLLLDVRAGLVGRDARVEEGVAVGCGEVGDLAELWIGDDLVEGVHCNDLAIVAGGFEKRACGVDGGDDFIDSASSAVDYLIADGDGVDGVPVVLRSVDDKLDLAGDVGDIPHACEELHVPSRSGGQDVGDLVTIGTIDTERAIVREGVHVGLDLISSLARAVRVVWGIRQSVARGASASSAAGWGGCGWCWGCGGLAWVGRGSCRWGWRSRLWR